MDPSEAETILRAIAHPERQEILRLLDGKRVSMAEIARHLDETIPHIRHHVLYLRRAGLIQEAGRDMAGNLTTTYWCSDGWTEKVRHVLPHELGRNSA